MWKHTGERANDDRCRVDHQCAMLAVGVFDQIADRFTAAAAGHVFIRCRAHEARFGQRFAGPACGSVPTTAGAAGDEEVDAVYNLVTAGKNRCSQR